jgi:glutathione S-transferase
MSGLHLVIGNKNYSSWSLRPWLAMSVTGLPFRESVIQLDTPATKRPLQNTAGQAGCPILHHGDITVWNPMILEFLAETFPDTESGQKQTKARAVARCLRRNARRLCPP